MSNARNLANLLGTDTQIQTADIANSAVTTAKVADAAFQANKNLIINGAMQVAQRDTSVSVSNGAGYKTVDRWHYTYGDSTANEFSTWTMSQDTDAPEGFASSTKFICTTAASAPSARTSTLIQQLIEGQNLQQLKYGLSSAEKLTASFWVKSNNTGTIGVSLMQYPNTRLYVESVSINSADTWEYKTVTFDGDTSSSLANDNTEGFRLRFAFEYNTDRIGGGASWAASGTPDGQSYLAPTGTSARTTSLNDTFYITGVQLEVGEQATPFEHRSYDEERLACYRYFFQFGTDGSTGVSGTNNNSNICLAYAQSNTTIQAPVKPPIPMRVQPTVTVSATGDVAAHLPGMVRSPATALSTQDNLSGFNSVNVNVTISSNSNFTLGRVCFFEFNGADKYLRLDAEL